MMSNKAWMMLSGKELRIGDVIRVAVTSMVLGLAGFGGIHPHGLRVLLDLAQCALGYFGYYQLQCDRCRGQVWAGRTCGNRHCPSCGHAKGERWVKERESELLLTSYFHVVFTIPGQLRDLVEENMAVLYELHFKVVRETLKDFAKDPKFLGATPSILMVLHTWNQRLDFHPHIHCLVSGGGWDHSVSRWVSGSNPDYLFPVAAMRIVYRAKYLAGLKKLYKKGELSLGYRSNAPFEEASAWTAFVSELYATDWIVYAKKPFAGPLQVLRYLARYTHRTAISNSRLEHLENDMVTFRYKNRRSKQTLRRTVPVATFIYLFSRHILPKNFCRIRRCGLLSGTKSDELRASQQQLREENLITSIRDQLLPQAALTPEIRPQAKCPHCELGNLVLILSLVPVKRILSLEQMPLPPPDASGTWSAFRDVA